jgi:hypothetical protein
MPMMIRAGMVKATLRISKVFICAILMSNDLAIEASSGAWLNQTTKVIKNAIQLKWSIFIFPVKANKLKEWVFFMITSNVKK